MGQTKMVDGGNDADTNNNTKPGPSVQFIIFDAPTKITSATAVESPGDHGEINLASMLVARQRRIIAAA